MVDRELLENIVRARLEQSAGRMSHYTLLRYFAAADNEHWTNLGIAIPKDDSDEAHESLIQTCRSMGVPHFVVGVDLGFMRELKKDREESCWGVFAGNLDWNSFSVLEDLTEQKVLTPDTRWSGSEDDLTTRWLEKAALVWGSSWVHFRYFPLSVPEGLAVQALQKELSPA